MCSDTITHWEGFRSTVQYSTVQYLVRFEAGDGYGWSEGGEWGLAKGCSVDVKEADGPEGGWSS